MLSELGVLTSALRSFAGSATSRLVYNFLESYSKKIPGRLIPRGPDNVPYLYRFYPQDDPASESKDIGVLLHKFVGSDAINEVHSHPWDWAVSMILHGGYLETRYKQANVERSPEGKIVRIDLDRRRQKVLMPKDINILLYDDLHRIELLDEQPCWTLFVHGPRRSTWGFANETDGTYREVAVRVFNDRPDIRNGGGPRGPQGPNGVVV